MGEFFDISLLWLFLSGIPIGIFAIVFGGTMFLSIPAFQLLFPQMAMGAIVGNIKMGGIFRAMIASYLLRKQIRIKPILFILLLFCAGAILGAFSIVKVSQVVILPALIIAILISEFSRQISKHIPISLYYVIAFLTGVFGGFLGAGILLFIIAILRIRIVEDEHLHHVRALAIFAELLIQIFSVVVFWFTGQLVFKIWVVWTLGSVIGGYIGGKILHRTGQFSPKAQKIFLRSAFAFALTISILKLF